jgi:hypothetical protein
MRIAVIGAGIFGCTAAIFAAKAGHEVHLFEQGNDILGGATSHNQFRMHQGYHYPRSPETVRECRKGLQSFAPFYAGTMVGTNPRYYAIADQGSFLNAGDYLKFLNDNDLPWQLANPNIIDHIQLAIRVNEVSLDPHKLYTDINIKLSLHKVNLHLNTAASKKMLDFDQVIVAAYAGINSVLSALDVGNEEYQFEVCEKPVIQMPPAFGNTSVVVMDGSFCSVDPFPGVGGHLMGHVEYAIWKRSFGVKPDIPHNLENYINKGIISNPEHTKWPAMQADGSRYIPMLEEAKHLGSMFTVRTVLKSVEETDARPTLVKRLDEKVVRIYSGKLPSAVDAAERALELVS